MYQINGNQIIIDDEIYEKMPQELKECFEIIHTNPDCPCYMLDKQSVSASRFFYCAKASKSERGSNNNHPTVKPLELCQYLVKLIAPPTGGIVLDPFAGSGTTLMACKKLGINYIGIEKEKEYVEIAKKRLLAVQSIPDTSVKKKTSKPKINTQEKQIELNF